MGMKQWRQKEQRLGVLTGSDLCKEPGGKRKGRGGSTFDRHRELLRQRSKQRYPQSSVWSRESAGWKKGLTPPNLSSDLFTCTLIHKDTCKHIITKCKKIKVYYLSVLPFIHITCAFTLDGPQETIMEYGIRIRCGHTENFRQQGAKTLVHGCSLRWGANPTTCLRATIETDNPSLWLVGVSRQFF